MLYKVQLLRCQSPTAFRISRRITRYMFLLTSLLYRHYIELTIIVNVEFSIDYCTLARFDIGMTQVERHEETLIVAECKTELQKSKRPHYPVRGPLHQSNQAASRYKKREIEIIFLFLLSGFHLSHHLFNNLKWVLLVLSPTPCSIWVSSWSLCNWVRRSTGKILWS